MVKLVPFSKAIGKQMGFVNTPKGLMVDAARLKEQKNGKLPVKEAKEDREVKGKDTKKEPASRPRRESPVVRQAKAAERQRLEDRGIY